MFMTDAPVNVMLKATSISKSYAGVHALRSASFDLRAGEVHALIGENGFLQHISHLRRHDRLINIVIETMNTLRRLADRETWCRSYGRDQSLETFARIGKLGTDNRRTVMDLQPNVTGDEPDDALGLGPLQDDSGI